MPKLDMHRPDVWERFAPECKYRARELAKFAEASGTHLERCSKHLFGRPTQKALNIFRMRAAPEVLERERSVKVAADKLGFKQHSHFTREFKAFYRTSPSDFLALPDEQREALKFAVRVNRADDKATWMRVEPPARQNVGLR